MGGGVLEFYRGRGSIHFALISPTTKYKHLSLRSDSDRSEFELILCMLASKPLTAQGFSAAALPTRSSISSNAAATEARQRERKREGSRCHLGAQQRMPHRKGARGALP